MNPMKTLFVLLIAFVSSNTVLSQTVYTDPLLPLADEFVIVYFNATGTPLEGYTGDVYAHTGVTVDGDQWQYVLSDWDINIDKAKLTNNGTDLYKLDLDPTLREFYGVPGSGEISEICLVFRSSDGGTQTSPDIFYPVYQESLNVSIIYPDVNPHFVDAGESINIIAEGMMSESISLYVDNVLITTVNGTNLEYTITASDIPDTKQWIKVIAVGEGEQVADSVYYYVRGTTTVAALPDNVRDGINYIDDHSVTLVLHAPFKSSIYTYGDFNNWEIGPDYKLKRTSDPGNTNTRYWVTINDLTPGEEYGFQYLVDEELIIADPYTEKVLDSWNDHWIDDETYPNLKPYPTGKTTEIVSILQTAQEGYEWQSTGFIPPSNEDLIIYELMIRDFIDAHDFKTLKDTLPYFKRLGINAIELMPVNEFEGNESWGYNPSFYFAPDKYYGPENDMKAFIDECHANGIAVIMDMVLNHAFGQNVMARLYWDSENNRPAANNPWFNAICPHEPFCWGSDFDHESDFTKAFVDSVNSYWLKEYKVDGFRFDFTQGFSNDGTGGSYNPTRISLIKRMADELWDVNPDAYVILEHWCDNNEEKELSNYGCMLWGNHNCHYNQATMGYASGPCGTWDFSGVSYKQRSWTEPHLVGFMESHDEERLMAKNLAYGNSHGDYKIKNEGTALKRIEQAGVFYFTIPGPKMIWQFGELGYDFHINYPGEIGGDDHRLDNKPIRWDYANDWRRDRVFQVWSSLIELKKEHTVFRTNNFNLSVAGAMKKIHLNSSSMNVTILGNFDVLAGDIVPGFQHTGYWYDFFSGDSVLVENTSEVINLQAGEYRLYTDEKLEYTGPDLGILDIDKGLAMNIYPNPSTEDINIIFSLSELSEVKIAVFNLNGQKIKTVIDQELLPGEHKTTWNTLNESGRKVSKGMYFCELTIDNKKVVQKVILK